ncbi:hypothetical protein PIB30_069794 [Stylosanthes scabra]|uniref:Uncharacterized protein n=1 Tax=Stylosanthes scabra TaxID=79078 RepID=A0ABU6WRB3_9FABA|nr:hypothetical protein [Stylosanthes scabra]
MATVLTPMIENNNARIDQVAQQVNELAENINPQPLRHQMYNHRNPPVILERGDARNRAQGANAAQAYENNITQAVEQILNRAGFNLRVTNQPYFVSPFPNFVQQAELPRGIKVPKDLVQKAVEDGRLKFAEKTEVKMDADPFQVTSNFAEMEEVFAFSANMATVESLSEEEAFEHDMFEAKRPIYPKAGEDLLDFLLRQREGEWQCRCLPEVQRHVRLDGNQSL